MGVGSCRVFFFLCEVKKVILLVSDESGDLGLTGSKFYTVLTLLLLHESDASEIISVANDLAKRCFQYPLRKWNNLKGKHKNDPHILADFLSSFLSRIQHQVCAIAVIMDKSSIPQQQSPKLYADAAYRMGWCYGLAFKRIGHFLNRTGLMARWIVDDNSETLKRNLTVYLTKKVPEIAGFIRRYSAPKFCSPKHQPVITLADFLAGLTNRCFESFVVEGKAALPFPYQPVWNELKRIFYKTLVLPSGQQWRWDGLIYWPVDKAEKIKSLLDC